MIPIAPSTVFGGPVTRAGSLGDGLDRCER
jgi:hypothetical protein